MADDLPLGLPHLKLQPGLSVGVLVNLTLGTILINRLFVTNRSQITPPLVLYRQLQGQKG
jgi:hypothetical protein